MTPEVAPAPGRTRPQSGSFRTFLSWLRRDDKLHERSPSIESFSSNGSDRTVTSFAFLKPAHYRPDTNVLPLVLPPPGPPTDSYRKRIRDRNLRRHLDRDLTLGRKYQLPTDNASIDAFSLPHARRNLRDFDKNERGRRAASECYQRRAPYVPGKRRAPSPPGQVRAASLAPENSQTNRRLRKRQAPQPPINHQIKLNKETPKIMDKESSKQPNSFISTTTKTTNEKSVNMDGGTNDKKVIFEKSCIYNKTKSECNFLRQIFEGKKRISVCDPIAVRLLPNISELDRQAAEILQMKLRNSKAKKECSDDDLEKMNIKYKTEMQTQIDNNEASKSKDIHEKQELKKMLKEMKDSLPKRTKPNSIKVEKYDYFKPSTSNQNYSQTDTPTLRIGSSDDTHNWQWSPLSQIKAPPKNIASSNNALKEYPDNKILQKALYKKELQQNPRLVENKLQISLTTVTTTNTKVNELLQTSRAPDVITAQVNKGFISTRKEGESALVKNIDNTSKILSKDIYVKPELPQSSQSDIIKTPFNVNKYFISKQKETQTALNIGTTSKNLFKGVDVKPELSISSTVANTVNTDTSVFKESGPEIRIFKSINKSDSTHYNLKNQTQNGSSGVTAKSCQQSSPLVVKDTASINKVVPNGSGIKIATCGSLSTSVDQETKHKNLIFELQQYIASGDEQGAANAAMQLAQLRLPGTILSSTLLSTKVETSQTGKGCKNIDNAPIASNENNECDIIKEIPKQNLENPQEPLSISTSKVTLTTSLFTKDPIPDVVPSTSNDIKQENNMQNDIAIQKAILIDKVEDVVGNEANHLQKSTVMPMTNNNLKAASLKSNLSKDELDKLIPVEVLVEDREAARGPVMLHVARGSRLGDLRRQAEITLGLPTHLQRWIVGRNLSTDDNTPLETLAGPDLRIPFYLCLVESELNKDATELNKDATMATETTTTAAAAGEVYAELVALEREALVANTEKFECGVCLDQQEVGAGAVLRECWHIFCRPCLRAALEAGAAAACPAAGCTGALQEREVRALLPHAQYERWLARGLAAAESGARHSFHCRTRDCVGWALCEPGVARFPCPVCRRVNCVPCQAIHEGVTCEQHKMNTQKDTATSVGARVDDESTRALLDSLVRRGEALACPECEAIITKKWGCDWVRCSACKTEICWVTRGRRWGPAGRGDTSAGCRCGVDGKRCHPTCAYCH